MTVASASRDCSISTQMVFSQHTDVCASVAIEPPSGIIWFLLDLRNSTGEFLAELGKLAKGPPIQAREKQVGSLKGGGTHNTPITNTQINTSTQVLLRVPKSELF